MRKSKVWLIVACLTVIMMGGCGNENLLLCEDGTNEKFDNIVILAGNHANSLKQDYDTLDDVLMSVALNYGNIAICVNDGESYIASSIEIPEQKSGLSESKRRSIAQSQVEQVSCFLDSEACMAKTPEVDLLESFEIASRTIQSSKYQNGVNAIYVYDTGINTTGYLDFTQMDLTTIDVDEVINKLAEEKMVVDLSNSTVFWYGLCDVQEPQEELSASQKENIKSIWEKYLNEAGATVHFMTDISTEKVEENLPYVTPVASVPTSEEWNNMEEMGETFPETIVFSEESIGFRAGTSELIDVANTEMELQKIVGYMNENSDFRLLIVGCTARWGELEEYCKPLSIERCQKVKKLLVEAGISGERIEIVGMGYENPFYRNDWGVDGSLIEPLAETNRCIVLLDAKSDLAVSIMENTWEE